MTRGRYALAVVALFLVEVAIALWATGRLRGLVGDVLVVILIYCFLRALFRFRPGRCALGVFLFACLIELCQAADYAALLGVDHIRWLSVVLGRTFSWEDILAYALGCGLAFLADRRN